MLVFAIFSIPYFFPITQRAARMKPLHLPTIRAEFPALQSDCVYLDNAGGSQVLRRVADRIHDYLLTTSVQLGASYAQSQRASEKVLLARRAVAEMINAAHADEVVLGPATTALMFILTQALLPCIRPGDEIIVTNTDHEANIGGWMRLSQAGAIIKIWEVNRDSLMLELDGLDTLLTAHTKWVAMTHASNVLGSVNPVAEVARRVHAVGGRLCVTVLPMHRIGWLMYKPAVRIFMCSVFTKCSGRTTPYCGGNVTICFRYPVSIIISSALKYCPISYSPAM